MTGDATQEDAIALLQQLGLKEYEAKCFVALTRVSSGTAKDVSELVDVPRTRVYDAIRVLESNGLVEVQHSSPQQFRAVSVDEATNILREQYEDRVASLRDTLTELEPASTAPEEPVHEVWSLTGDEAIRNRSQRLVADAEEEVVFVVRDEPSDAEVATLAAACQRDVDIRVGVLSDDLREDLSAALPDAEIFSTGLEWLQPVTAEEEEHVDTLLLVDRERMLVSSTDEAVSSDARQAVCGHGSGNAVVLVVRRALSARR